MDAPDFTLLVQDHIKLIHKVARAYCRNEADRDDVAQEIVAQLWRSRHNYDPSHGSSTWIYRVALNVAISFYRRESRHSGSRRAPAEVLISVAEELEDEPSAEVELIGRLLSELDELHRALVLLYLDGNDHATIGEILGISRSNVGTKLDRIRKKLRRAFDERSANRKDS